MGRVCLVRWGLSQDRNAGSGASPWLLRIRGHTTDLAGHNVLLVEKGVYYPCNELPGTEGAAFEVLQGGL